MVSVGSESGKGLGKGAACGSSGSFGGGARGGASFPGRSGVTVAYRNAGHLWMGLKGWGGRLMGFFGSFS